MKASEIISDIEGIVKSLTDGLYSKWRIGRASNPEESKIQHEIQIVGEIGMPLP